MPDTVDLRHLIKQCSECGQRFSPAAVFCPFDGAVLVDAVRPGELDPLLGQTLDGRYAIESTIGEGGMGTVYRARHVTLGRPLAVKVLRADLAQEPELSERFLQEAQATAAIKHPNVVAITDFGRLADARPYFVMELLAGRTLASLMKRSEANANVGVLPARRLKAGGALPPRLAAQVAVEVAGGLGAAHEAGVVHRDLKPENVFLVGPPGNETKALRVVDFGAAIVLGRSRLTKKGIVFGTPFYMSPEQAAGHDVDHRTDIYALGIILYEMVTGKVPFEGETYMGVLTQHMFVAPTPPSQLAPALAGQLGALEGIILRALEKEPSARFASMQELADAVTSAMDQIGARGPSWPTPASVSQAPAHGIADELELPSLAELRGSVERASSPPRSSAVPRAAWVVLAVVLAGGAGILALSAVRRARTTPSNTETALRAAPPAPTPSSTPTQPPAPPSAPPSATASAPASSASETVVRPAPTRRPRGPAGASQPSTPGLGPDPFLTPR